MKSKHDMLGMYTSSVSSEMIAPIKGVIHFAEALIRKLKDQKLIKDAELILSTSNLIYA